MVHPLFAGFSRRRVQRAGKTYGAPDGREGARQIGHECDREPERRAADHAGRKTHAQRAGDARRDDEPAPPRCERARHCAPVHELLGEATGALDGEPAAAPIALAADPRTQPAAPCERDPPERDACPAGHGRRIGKRRHRLGDRTW